MQTSRSNAGSSRLKARPVPPSTFNSAAFSTPPLAPSISAPIQTSAVGPSALAPTPSPMGFAPLQPTQSSLASLTPQRPAMPTQTSSGPNYNISLTPQQPAMKPQQPSMLRPTPSQSNSFSQMGQASSLPQPVHPTAPARPAQPPVAPPPGWSSGLMQPTSAPKPTWGTSGKASGGWDDFDPLK